MCSLVSAALPVTRSIKQRVELEESRQARSPIFNPSIGSVRRAKLSAKRSSLPRDLTKLIRSHEKVVKDKNRKDNHKITRVRFLMRRILLKFIATRTNLIAKYHQSSRRILTLLIPRLCEHRDFFKMASNFFLSYNLF